MHTYFLVVRLQLIRVTGRKKRGLVYTYLLGVRLQVNTCAERKKKGFVYTYLLVVRLQVNTCRERKKRGFVYTYSFVVRLQVITSTRKKEKKFSAHVLLSSRMNSVFTNCTTVSIIRKRCSRNRRTATLLASFPYPGEIKIVLVHHLRDLLPHFTITLKNAR